MALAFTFLFFTLHLAAMRNEILRRRVRTMQLMQAQEATHDPEKWDRFSDKIMRRKDA